MSSTATVEKRTTIAVHHTDTSDADWDAGTHVGRCPAEEAPLRKLHAWVDPDGDPDVKSSYKFPHHMVSAGGDIGAANTRACSNGIAVLNGGRGGADIPDSDRPGVHRHLAAHITDAGVEAPELKSVRLVDVPNREVRSSSGKFELRAAGENGETIGFRGHAALFDTPAMITGMFESWREQVAPGAFTRTIRQDDVAFLVDHETNLVLARNSAGNLQLAEDSVGLLVDADIVPTTYARDLEQNLRAGNLKGMSFAFEVVAEDWEFDGDIPLRTLREVRLWDVSVVTFPAYEETDAALRSLKEARAARNIIGIPARSPVRPKQWERHVGKNRALGIWQLGEDHPFKEA